MAKDKHNNQDDSEAPSSSKSSNTNKGIWGDSRFQHLLADPRFKNLPKTQRKVKIDKRFQSMFTDNKFKVKYTVDKYGRRVNQSNAEDLKKFYEINSDDEESGSDGVDNAVKDDKNAIDEEDDENIEEEQRKEELAISGDAEKDDKVVNYEDENDALASDGETVSKPLRERLFDPQIDYARGEGRLITDSSSDDESTEDEDDPDVYIEHTWGELDADAERTDESTHRLAVCNMDWDRIRAVDLMVLLNSFLPPGGSIISVKIYKSEYGKKRLQEEELRGPAELVEMGKEFSNGDDEVKSNHSDNEESEEDEPKEQDSDAEEGDDYHMEKLRQYQLNRLRYFYAVVVCDSVATADKIYAECDGLEYESSATRVDLRFIPDDTTFDDEPTDVCTDLPDPNNYKPRLFTTTALQQAKVDLTWDETAVERLELSERLLAGKLEEVDDRDLRKIVAYSSEEEEEEVDSDEADKDEEKPMMQLEEEAEKRGEKPKKAKKNDAINKYKEILAGIKQKEEEEKKKKIELEYTWSLDPKHDLEIEDNRELSTNEKPNSELTPIEKVLKKRSEKNKQRKLERKKKKRIAQGLDPDADDSDSDSLPDGVDMNDPYFAEEFADGDFIDPKTKKKEKKKKLEEAKAIDEEEAEKQAKELELLLDDEDLEQKCKQHFSLDKILKAEQETKSKRKRRKQLKKSKSEIAEKAKSMQIEDDFKLNLDDDRFKAIYSSPLFNIDPTHSHFKKTKGMELLIQEKLKRRYGDGTNGDVVAAKESIEAEPQSKKPKKLLEQTLLVKSLKRKLQAQQK